MEKPKARQPDRYKRQGGGGQHMPGLGGFCGGGSRQKAGGCLDRTIRQPG